MTDDAAGVDVAVSEMETFTTDDMKREFSLFLTALWHEAGYWTHAPLGPIEYDMANYLQYGPNRVCLHAWREFGKSHITAAYACWRLWTDDTRTLEVMICSAAEGLAKNILHRIRGWIENIWFLEDLKPRAHGPREIGTPERQGAVQYDVRGHSGMNPSLLAIGIKGQRTGRRAHLILADDVETPETSETIEARQKLRNKISEFDRIIYKGTDADGDDEEDPGKIVYLGTPQHEETIYAELPSKGYFPRTWPITYPANDEPIINLAPMLERALARGEAKPGDPTAPYRFPRDLVAKIKATEGPSGFAMQYQLHMGLDEENRYPLKLHDFIVLDVHPKIAPETIVWGRMSPRGSTACDDIPSIGLHGDMFYAPVLVDEKWSNYHTTKMFIDPAGGASDETAWCIIGMLNGYLYVKRVNAYSGAHSTENLERIADDAQQYRVNDIAIETNFGGSMMAQLLQPVLRTRFLKPGENSDHPDGWAATIDGIHNTKQKELRIIETLEPVMHQHRIVIDRSVANDRVLMHQLTRLTRARNCLQHDDRLDALAGAVGMMAPWLNRSSTDVAASREAEAQEAAIREWCSTYNLGDPTPNFITPELPRRNRAV